jgi:hypothetical protein
MIEILTVTGPVSGQKRVLLQGEHGIVILGPPAQRELLRWFRKHEPKTWQEIVRER